MSPPNDRSDGRHRRTRRQGRRKAHRPLRTLEALEDRLVLSLVPTLTSLTTPVSSVTVIQPIRGLDEQGLA